MAFGIYDRGPTSGTAGPTRPDSQGYHGQTAQPNVTSTLQGPVGTAYAQTAHHSTGSTAPHGSGATAGASTPVLSNGTIPPASAPQPMGGAVPTGVGQYPNPWGAWPGRPPSTIFQGMELSGEPFAAYEAGTISPFQRPDLATQAQQTALLQRVLSSPEVLSPEHVAMLQERNKEAALFMAQQQQELARQQAVSRGLTPGRSGQVQATERRLQQGAQDAILGGNRDLAVQAAQMNAQARLQALQAGEQALSGQVGRETALYDTGLRGQLAQEQLRQAGAGSAQQAQQLALQRALAQAGINQNAAASAGDAYSTDLDAYFRQAALNAQQQLAQQGFGLDERRLSEQGRQFDLGYGLNQAALANNILQGNLGYGLNLAQLQQQAQNNMFSMRFGGR